MGEREASLDTMAVAKEDMLMIWRARQERGGERKADEDEDGYGYASG